MSTSGFPITAARTMFSAVATNKNKPYQLVFSDQESATNIATDSSTFSNQLVDQINQSFGTDNKTKTSNINEFTRFVSNDEFKKFSQIKDPGDKALVEATFNEISGNKTEATISNLADYIRTRDSKDGKTDGKAVLNFLI